MNQLIYHVLFLLTTFHTLCYQKIYWYLTDTSFLDFRYMQPGWWKHCKSFIPLKKKRKRSVADFRGWMRRNNKKHFHHKLKQPLWEQGNTFKSERMRAVTHERHGSDTMLERVCALRENVQRWTENESLVKVSSNTFSSQLGSGWHILHWARDAVGWKEMRDISRTAPCLKRFLQCLCKLQL